MFAYVAMFYLASNVQFITGTAIFFAVIFLFGAMTMMIIRSDNSNTLQTMSDDDLKTLEGEEKLPYKFSTLLHRYDVGQEWRQRVAKEIVTRKRFKQFSRIGVIALCIAIIMPSKEVMYVGIGAMAVGDVAEAVGNSAIYNKTMELVEIKIEAAVQDAKKELVSEAKEVASAAK